jgi:hypothetical protein
MTQVNIPAGSPTVRWEYEKRLKEFKEAFNDALKSLGKPKALHAFMQYLRKDYRSELDRIVRAAANLDGEIVDSREAAWLALLAPYILMSAYDLTYCYAGPRRIEDLDDVAQNVVAKVWAYFKTWFKLTGLVLDGLSNDHLPDHLLDRLSALKNKRLRREDFDKALVPLLSDEERVLYISMIIDRAKKPSPNLHSSHDLERYIQTCVVNACNDHYRKKNQRDRVRKLITQNPKRIERIMLRAERAQSIEICSIE